MRTVTRGIVATVATVGMLSVGLVGCRKADGTAGDEAVVEEVTDATADGGDGTDATDADATVTDDGTEQEGIWVVTRVLESYQHDADGDGTLEDDSTDEVTYDIDGQGNIIAVHMGTVVPSGEGDDWSYDETFEHDGDGFVTACTTVEGGTSQTSTYRNEFDEAGDLRTVTVRTAEGGEFVYEISYDEDGNVTSVGGDGTTAKFDPDGNLTEIKGWLRHAYEYGEDGHLVGDKVIMTEFDDDGNERETVTESTIECEYDENKNMTSKVIKGEDGSVSTTAYEYTYVANPSKGARLYTMREMSLLEFL